MSVRATVVTIAALALAAPAAAHAESETRLYLEAGVSGKLRKRLELAFDQHLRFDQDVSRLRAIMPELSLTYRLHKLLRAGVGYRLQYQRNNDGELVVRHRVQADLRVRYDFGPVEVSYRARFQEQIRSWDNRRHTLRNRLAVRFEPLAPWIPAAYVETFQRIGDEDADPIYLQRIRLQASLAYDRKHDTVELYYRVEVAQSDPFLPTPHIIGLGYHHEL